MLRQKFSLVTKKMPLVRKDSHVLFYYFKAQRHYKRDRLNVFRRNGPKKPVERFVSTPMIEPVSACEVKVIKSSFEM